MKYFDIRELETIQVKLKMGGNGTGQWGPEIRLELLGVGWKEDEIIETIRQDVSKIFGYTFEVVRK